MATENIAIEVIDKVASSIATKFENIASTARTADSAVTKLKSNLEQLSKSSVSKLQSEMSRLSGELQRMTAIQSRLSAAQGQAATAAQRLATEQQRTAAAAARAAAAQTQAATATTKGATAAQQLAAATTRATTAQTQSSLAALKLQQAQAAQAAQAEKAGVSMGRMASAVTVLLVGVKALKEVIGGADEYQALSNKLQVVSTSTEQVAELQGRLFEVANKTRSGVEATTTAFVRFDNALVGMGKSQEETLRLTETVNKLLVVGGAAATEQASALLQLSQAFNKGKLDGDEFRSLMENMPRQVKSAIAQTLGIAETEIFKASANGLITADVLFNAFKRLEQFADSNFDKTIATFNQSLEVFKNRFIEASGEIDKSLGLISTLVDFVGKLGDLLPQVSYAFQAFNTEQKNAAEGSAVLNGLLEAGLVIFQTIAVVASDVVFVFQGVGREIGAIAAQLDALAHLDFEGFNAISVAVKDDAARARKELDEFQKRIMSISTNPADNPAAKKQAGAPGMSFLRFAGQNTQGAPAASAKKIKADTKAARLAESRASNLDKVNRSLTEELTALQRLGPEYALSNKMLEIENNLLDKKVVLTDKERASIEQKVKAIQDQSGLNAMKEINKQMAEEAKLLDMLPKQREIEQQMMQLENEAIAKGIPDREKFLAQKREELTLMQQQQGLADARASLFAQFQQPREEFANKATAVGEMTNATDKTTATADLLKQSGIDVETLQIGLDAQLNAFQTYYDNLNILHQKGVVSEEQYAAARTQIAMKEQELRLQSSDAFFGGLAQLSKSGNKELARIGKAAAIVQATIQGYVSISNALAVQPYYVGIGLAIGAAATMASQISSIQSTNTGFKSGGYTGNMPTNQTAGVVHGQEFVMNAEATNRIGVSNLQAMQDGRSLQGSGASVGSGGGVMGLNINISNEIPGAQYEVQQIDENTVEIIAKRVVDERTDQVTANNLASPSSKTSRALQRNTDSRRKV